jgi:SAM-dependent methyltransferase
VLDVGCGLGRYTLPLVRRGLAVEGIDISPDLLERLERTLPAEAGVKLHLADVLDPPAELEGGFDAVLGGFVLHHIHDVPASLQAMAALARPGGALAFLEPNPFNPLYYVQMAISPTMTWEGDRGMLGMRRAPLLAAMRAAGVPEPSFERFGFFPPFLADRPRAAPVERAIESIPLLKPLLPFQLVGGRTVGPDGPGYL